MLDYKIVLTKPDTPLVSTLAPVALNIWDEFLTLQLSPETQRSYAAALKDFFRREMGLVVSPEAIGSFLALSEHEAIGRVLAYRGQLINAGLSAATLNSRLAGLRSFVTHACKRGLCKFRLDDIKSVKAQSYKDTRGVSIELIQQIFSHLDLSIPLGKRNYAMLRLLWDNALRRAEVCYYLRGREKLIRNGSIWLRQLWKRFQIGWPVWGKRNVLHCLFLVGIIG
jgi:integrase/recombinase XerC